jgi:hypothetical protein
MRIFKHNALAFIFCASSLFAGTVSAKEIVHVKYEDNGAGVRTLISKMVAESGPGQSHEISYPQFIAEHQPLKAGTIVEAWLKDDAAANAFIAERKIQAAKEPEFEAADDELFTIVESGSSQNRIDLVFMGDGYTQAERQKFISDIQRIVNDMFVGDTFASYLPVFNVYAVFRASNESGIGRNDRPKDTAYGLYREGNTLRAIFPTNTTALRASCRAAPGCDYPVVIANDPNYGGLGGEFAISTSSETSGTVVLRHELGHNFGRVGEEYDGGGYFGANNSSSVASLKWKHWTTDAVTRAEPSKARFLGWPWHNLSSGPYSTTFSCDANYPHASINLSASGLPNADSLKIELDGQVLPYVGPGTDDRSFHTYESEGFGAGNHTLKFTQMESDTNNWVSSIAIHEYAADYHFDEDYIGAYPVFSQSGSVAGFRPTHETCLMRNMQSTSFCKVCQENNWLEFFQRVKMIDSISSANSGANTTVTLQTQKLGQFRSASGGFTSTQDPGAVQIRWSRNGVAVPELNDQTVWTKATTDVRGNWAVDVSFVTPEVRKDTRNLLKDRKTITVN